MNVLLVYPAVPPTFWSYVHALRFLHKRAVLPPLGLLTVAALLPAEWGKRLVDLNVQALDDADLAWADCVFISAMAIQRQAARQLIARCHAAGKRIVAGGPLFTAEYASFEHVDHFVLGEAEPTLPRLVKDLSAGCARRTYRCRGFAEMAASPVPLWALADLSQYASAGVQFSRGCPFDCEFCNVTALLGRKPRVKSAGQVVAELDALHDAGWRGQVFFVDDNLIGNRPAVSRELLPALAAWQRQRGPVSFCTQASINLADDPALVEQMVQAGFNMVFIGIETPDDAALVECGKRQNVRRDLVADVKRLHRAGLEVQGGFIVGFDHDTPGTFARQVEFIRRSGIVTAMVGMLQAPPGTRLAQRLRAENRLLGSSSGDNTDGTTNIQPRMGLEALRDGYDWLLRQLYAPHPYYQRIRLFLREFRGPSLRGPLQSQHLRAFARSMIQLGVIGGERIEYWFLLLWTLLNRPTLLPVAIRLAVCGNHHRRIWQARLADVAGTASPAATTSSAR